MARVRDLWFRTVKGSDGQTVRYKSARHPDNGGGKAAKRWLALWTGPDGKECSKAFTKRVDAEKHGIAREADRLRGVYIDDRVGKIKLHQYGEDKWIPSQVHLRRNSISTYETHLRTHIYRLLGERKMNSLTRSDMKAFVASISRELAPSTVHTVFAVLRSLRLFHPDGPGRGGPAEGGSG